MEIRDYLRDAAGSWSLVFDLSITTSGRYSASLCWELTAKVDIKGEKGFFGNPD